METGKFEIEIVDDEIIHVISHITNEPPLRLRQVCERYGEDAEDVRHYDVYLADFPSGTMVLKKTESREVFNYETYLAGRDLPVPHYFGKWAEDDKLWILMENIRGEDLRDMTDELALSAADTLSQIQNAYWQADEAEFAEKKTDKRFEVYWQRILKRASSVAYDPDLRKAYQLFLDRQLVCPRTLSNGDFLQFNVMNQGGHVYSIDWGFGGIMPYSLDIARFIAHGTVDRSSFPFYMTEDQKKLFIDRVYEKLEQKPDYAQYRRDIQLALLNEYIEFVEADEDWNGEYQRKANALAREILKR